jgi:hypothetical protein
VSASKARLEAMLLENSSGDYLNRESETRRREKKYFVCRGREGEEEIDRERERKSMTRGRARRAGPGIGMY